MSEAHPQTNIGPYESYLRTVLSELDASDVIGRIWRRDHTVWKPDPSEITNRLGWLTVTDFMHDQVGTLESFSLDVQKAGFCHIILLGMGGSSLGAAVLGQTFGKDGQYPQLLVLDSTLPESIQVAVDSIDPALALFVVSSKSGTTIEPLALYAYFRDLVEQKTGETKAGQHFVAITDAGTPLVALAQRDAFRHIFLNPADIGGRYSVLSYFGLVPAALAGIDIIALVTRADNMRQVCYPGLRAYHNAGAWLGACIGTLALRGRDKLTLVTSPSIKAFGLWVEQLIAESTGKEGKGIIPVANEPLMTPSCYGGDRLFVYLRVQDDKNEDGDTAIHHLISSGQPVLVLDLLDPYDLGAEFFRWEFATAVASALLGVHPFNQPDVQKSKDATSHQLQEFATMGHPPELGTTGSLVNLLTHAESGMYLAIMAYLPQTREIDEALSKVRRAVGQSYHIATTLGYGPRFLHSTGQLYKGGQNTGLFLQVTTDHPIDLPVPGETYTFGVIADSEALGDFQALEEAVRRILRILLSKGEASLIDKLLKST